MLAVGDTVARRIKTLRTDERTMRSAGGAACNELSGSLARIRAWVDFCHLSILGVRAKIGMTTFSSAVPNT
jgi:hypothetical protein